MLRLGRWPPADAVRFGHLQERLRVRVGLFDGEDSAGSLRDRGPIGRVDRHLSVIKKTVDLPLDAFGRHEREA